MKKKLLSILVCMVMVAGLLTACGSGETDTDADIKAPATDDKASDDEASDDEASDGESYTFGYTCMDGTNPFFVIIEETMRKAVEANGDTFISTDPANDVTLQITQIEDMITQGMDGIFLNPAEAEGILPALDMLKEAGVPIINFDAEVADMEYVTSYVGSDNYNAGYVCGLDLVEKIPEGGPIIILDSPKLFVKCWGVIPLNHAPVLDLGLF